MLLYYLLYGLVLVSGEVEDLYLRNDSFVRLTESNISLVNSIDRVWVVLFYHVMCESCQMYAPTWKAFAQEAQGWSRVFQVAVVHCADPDISSLCVSKNITSYPTIKIYLPGYNSEGMIFKYTKDTNKTVEELLNYVVLVAETVQKPPVMWPKLTPVRSVDEVWAEAPRGTTRAFIYVEDQNNHTRMGSQLSLEATQYPNVVVRRMLTTDAPSDVTGVPALYEVYRDGSLHLVLSGNDRESLMNVVQANGGGLTSTTRASGSSISPVPTVIPDGLHLRDLESNIYHSFWVEVAAVPVLEGNTLIALKEYVHILALYHPGGTSMHSFLTRVDDMLRTDSQTSITAQKWLDSINQIQIEEGYPPMTANWTGCEGSNPRFRGFPCSMWMTFHGLTVRAYLQSVFPQAATDIISAIRGYVINFLQCDECSKNFERETAGFKIKDAGDGVLYLWRIHNDVNNRLKGTITEDPRHPKVQFPIAKACPACHRDGQWNNDEVLSYLSDFYKPEAVVNDGIESESTTGGASVPCLIAWYLSCVVYCLLLLAH